MKQTSSFRKSNSNEVYQIGNFINWYSMNVETIASNVKYFRKILRINGLKIAQNEVYSGNFLQAHKT